MHHTIISKLPPSIGTYCLGPIGHIHCERLKVHVQNWHFMKIFNKDDLYSLAIELELIVMRRHMGVHKLLFQDTNITYSFS